MSQNRTDTTQPTQNQNNEMSEDPRDGNRGERGGLTGGKPGGDEESPVERKPPHDAQDKSTIEAFGEEGAGKAEQEQAR